MKLATIREAIRNCFKPRYVFRRADSGEFVSEAYAKRNPHTTIRQRILFPRSGHHK